MGDIDLKLIQGNIWNAYFQEIIQQPLLIITTNNVIKSNGELVMGKGIAAEAAAIWPWLPKHAADMLYARTRPHDDYHFLLLGPVALLQTKRDWKDKSDLALIHNGLLDLKDFCSHFPKVGVYMPCPGIGNGGLSIDEVKPLLEEILSSERVSVFYK